MQVGADSQVLEYEGRRSLTVSRGGDEAWRGLMTRPQAGRPVPSPRGRPLACINLHLGVGLCMRVHTHTCAILQERGNFAWERLRASCGFDWRAMPRARVRVWVQAAVHACRLPGQKAVCSLEALAPGSAAARQIPPREPTCVTRGRSGARAGEPLQRGFYSVPGSFSHHRVISELAN